MEVIAKTCNLKEIADEDVTSKITHLKNEEFLIATKEPVTITINCEKDKTVEYKKIEPGN